MEIRDVKVRVEGILNFVTPGPWANNIHGVKTNIEGCLNFFSYLYIYGKEPNLAKSSYA
jgi:hypothetical protein